MFCSQCGTAVDEGKNFCPNCGNALVSDRPAAAQASAEKSEAPSPPQSFAPAESVPPVTGREYAPAATARPKRKALTATVSVLFGLLIFGCMTSAVPISTVKNTLESQRISNEIRELDISQVKIGEFITEEEITLTINKREYSYEDFDKNTTAAEYTEALFSAYRFDEDDVLAMAEEIDVMGFVGDVAQGYESYILTGNDPEPVTKKSVMKLVEKCEKYIRSEYPSISNADFSKAETVLDENRSTLRKLNPKKVLSDTGEVTSQVLSTPVIVVLWAAAAVFAGLILLISRDPSAAFITCGCCAVVSGVLLLAATFIYPSMLGANVLGYDFVSKLVTELIEATLAVDLRIASFILIGCGAAAIAIGVVTNIVIGKVNSARQRRTAQ